LNNGYGELMGWRNRNRLLDLDKLLPVLQSKSIDEFRAHFNRALDDAIINDELQRQAKWTEAIAVGDQAFVKAVEERIRGRQEMEIRQEAGCGFCEKNTARFCRPKMRPYAIYLLSQNSVGALGCNGLGKVGGFILDHF